MSRWSCNDAIAMERRHILEGEKRIARQEALMSELLRKEHTTLMPMATDVLDILRECQEMSKTRLLALEGHSGEALYHKTALCRQP